MTYNLKCVAITFF